MYIVCRLGATVIRGGCGTIDGMYALHDTGWPGLVTGGSKSKLIQRN